MKKILTITLLLLTSFTYACDVDLQLHLPELQQQSLLLALQQAPQRDVYDYSFEQLKSDNALDVPIKVLAANAPNCEYWGERRICHELQ